MERQEGTRSETDKITGIRNGGGFIKIIYAPDQASFGIKPRAKILYVQIADSQDLRSVLQVRTQLRPELNPAIKRCAQERKRILCHLVMLLCKVLLNHAEPLLKPLLITLSRFNNIHNTPKSSSHV